jgi:hypothetical protein
MAVKKIVMKQIKEVQRRNWEEGKGALFLTQR